MAEITFRECRSAARSVRAAEFGREARRAARPVSFVGLVRERAPIPVMLYLAGREGRLVWQNEAGFAVLEPPIAQRNKLLSGGLRLSVIRTIDRWWESLVMLLPPATSLLVAVLFALVTAVFVPRPFSAVLVLAILILPTLGMVYLALTMVSGLIASGRFLFQLGKQRDPVELASGANWHVRLCHQVDQARAHALIDSTASRMVGLVTERVRGAAPPLGAYAETVQVTEPLAFLMPAVTTSAMREAIRKAGRIQSPYGPDGNVVVLCLQGSQKPIRTSFDKGSFVFWYLCALALGIGVDAFVVAQLERSECVGATCVGSPDTYGLALRWLAGRLLPWGQDNLTPASPVSWIIGWLFSVAGLMTIPVGYKSARSAIGASREQQRLFAESVERAVSQAVILILVVKQLERDSIMAAVRALNGVSPARRFYEQHTVFELGSIGGATVLLAQSGRQGMAGPSGMLSTAGSVINACRPDYVILTGICYGLWDRDEEIGDVIVSQAVYDIDHSKMIDGEDGPIAQHRGDRVSPGVALLDRFNSATADWTAQSRVHFGEMLSSNTLLDSAELREKLRKDHPYAAGGDMEGAAVYAAAAKARVDWIVVKGISDRGKDVTDRHQALAAHNAASFVAYTISLGGFQRRIS